MVLCSPDKLSEYTVSVCEEFRLMGREIFVDDLLRGYIVFCHPPSSTS